MAATRPVSLASTVTHLEEVDEEQAPLSTYTIFSAATIPGNKFFKKKSRASCVSLIPHNESSHTGDRVHPP